MIPTWDLITLTSPCVGSGHCHRAPTVDSVLWPGHQNHPHIPHLRRWWHGEMHSGEGLLSGRWSHQNSLQISEILETQTVAGVWSFLTDPDFGMLMIFRITIVALSFAVGFPLLALKGPIGSDLIEAISPWLQWHVFIYLIFLVLSICTLFNRFLLIYNSPPPSCPHPSLAEAGSVVFGIIQGAGANI